ncbi:envelope glycoprotein [Galidia ERV]|nr:envelope glycoprotein [Galidia ERV]
MEGLSHPRPPQTQAVPVQYGTLTVTLFYITLLPLVEGGWRLQSRGDASNRALGLLWGNPYDCKGGITGSAPPDHFQERDCGDKTAYLTYNKAMGNNFGDGWKCVTKPQVKIQSGRRPGDCPTECLTTIATEMHSSCYQEAQECTHPNGQVYFTAILQKTYSRSSGGGHNYSQGRGTSKYAQASCWGTPGKPVCWPLKAPIHVSDGGGPTDKIKKKKLVQKKIGQIIQTRYPPLRYPSFTHSNPGGLDKNFNLLTATHRTLNSSNHDLARNCWLCMTVGTPLPTATPANSSMLGGSNCNLSLPFRVQPVGFNNSICHQGPSRNDNYNLDVGFITFSKCSETLEHSGPLCPARGQVFICGENLAFTALPLNWTGLCVQGTVLPDIDIIPGDEPVPVPSLDYIAGRQKRAVQFIPLVIGLGLTGALVTGSAGLGVSVHSYNKLASQLIDDVQALSGTINDLQDQIDSLAEVVLQNRRGLDLLTAEQGGICLALQERCCLYANKSGIVRNKIKKLQEDLEERRKQLFENPLWGGLNGLLPYLLPLLGPLFGLLIVLSVGPYIFKTVVGLIQAKTQDLKLMVLRTHYQPITENTKSYTQYLPESGEANTYESRI